jgi:ribA/ribD-fused uncharacterized protein
MDTRLKMSESETHIFFVGGPFSQWHRSEIKETLPTHFLKRNHRFNCGEQYMMASKAVFFEDFDTLIDIMQEMDPSKQKAFGRKVANFDPSKWAEVARDIVYLGNLAKFTQNPDLAYYLKETGSKTLVEGAWYDEVWGVKLEYCDPLILDSANWKGTNWLGEVLMRVRKEMFGT